MLKLRYKSKKSDLTYEIIIVNDGTPDNSLKIAEDYAKSHNNITIISQENQGLGGARNTGLKAASGDYVWFIDSDDWINLNSLLILEPFLKLQLDAITFGAADFINNMNIPRFKERKNANKILSGIDIIKNSQLNVCVPFTIYNRNYLINNNLFMKTKLFHEDLEFSPRAYIFLKRVIILNDILYFVRHNPTSITRTLNFKRAFDYLTIIENLYQFIEFNHTQYDSYMYDFIGRAFNNSLQIIYKADESNKQLYNKELLLKKRIIIRSLFKARKSQYKIIGVTFYMFSSHIISIYYNIFHRK